MKKYDIYEAMSEEGECLRVAIEQGADYGRVFDASNFFPATDDPPERVGEIRISGDVGFVPGSFRVRTG